MSDLVHMAHNFRKAASLVEGIIEAALNGLPIDPPTYDLLHYVSHVDPATRAGFVQAGYVSGRHGANPTPMIEKTIRAGLLEKHHDLKDGRTYRMCMTEAGLDAYHEATKRINAALSNGDAGRLLGTISPECLNDLRAASQGAIDAMPRTISGVSGRRLTCRAPGSQMVLE